MEPQESGVYAHWGASVYDLTLLVWSDFPLCPFQTANKWFAISFPCIKRLTQPVRSSCLLRPEQLRLPKCICRAAALICSLTGIVKQPISSCGNQWMRGNCLGEYLFHFCNSVSAFLFFFVGVLETLSVWMKNHKPQQMLSRSTPLLLYLSGRQLVAALSLGSLRVAVNQHPLELKLQRDVNITTIIVLRIQR